MDCEKSSNPRWRNAKVDFNRYRDLHPDGQRLISGWFNRAWQMRHNEPEDCFEGFVFAWFSINGWAECVTGLTMDSKYVEALRFNVEMSEKFNKLCADTSSEVARHVHEFAQYFPIFKAQSIRQSKQRTRRQKQQWIEPRSQKRVDITEAYLSNEIKDFAPKCWKEHKDKGEDVPIDWSHSLEAIYRVRCNLFHGEKAVSSEMDQRIVSSSFKLLVNFFRDAKYL